MKHKLYHDLASWWPLLSAPEDYAEEAGFYARLLKESCEHTPRSLLELGSGGGNNAWHLKGSFELTLLEPSTEMVTVSRSLNPECEHLEGDMRTVRLGRVFDVVFVHDAIMYMTTREDLRKAMETAYVHTKPGGAAVFAPDHVRETFGPSTRSGGRNGQHRGMRYLEWTWDPDPEDDVYTVDYAFLLRCKNGSVRVEHDRHIEGLFSRKTWMGLMSEVGFSPNRVSFNHSEMAGVELDVFVGKKPSA